MPKKQKSVVMKPMDENVPSYARNVPYKSVNERKKINSKEIFDNYDQKKTPTNKKKQTTKKKQAPKGYHYMSSGKLMKDSDMNKSTY